MTDEGQPDSATRAGFSSGYALLLLGVALPLVVSVLIVWMLAPDARWRAILLGAVLLLNAVWWLRLLWARLRRNERRAVAARRAG